MSDTKKTVVDTTRDNEKITAFLLAQFDTAYKLNQFLQEYVWPAYRGREGWRKRGADTLEAWFWPGSLQRVTVREYERCSVGTVLMQRNQDGTFTPHRKLRKYGFAVAGPPQATP